MFTAEEARQLSNKPVVDIVKEALEKIKLVAMKGENDIRLTRELNKLWNVHDDRWLQAYDMLILLGFNVTAMDIFNSSMCTVISW